MKSSASLHGLFKPEKMNKLLEKEKLNISEVLEGAPKQIMVNAKPFDINVESFNPAEAAALSKSLDGEGPIMGVYADPNDYYDGKSDHIEFPVQILSKESGQLVTKEETWTVPYASDIDAIDDEFNAYIDNLRASLTYPVFVVTMEKQEDDLDKTRLSKSATALGYLAFYSVNLKVERDGTSNEEFEMWWGPQNGYTHNHSSMNGNSSTDVYGNSYHKADVNVKSKTYYAHDPTDQIRVYVPLVPLDNDGNNVQAVTPWEDDLYGGEMDRDALYDVNGTPFTAPTWRDEYNWANGYIYHDNIFRAYVDNNTGGILDQDDQYSQGALYNGTYNNVYSRTSNGAITINTADAPYVDNPSSKGLGDMTWQFSLR